MAQNTNQVSTAEIRSQIERTRVELGRTIDAIQDRVSPRRFMRDAMDTISDATIGRAKRLAHRVSESVNSGSASPNASAVLDSARSNLTMSALIGTAVSALFVALMTRSRRPTLARSLSGLAISLAMASFAQSRTRRQPPRDPYPNAL